jgi:hypothetical protein
MTLTRNSPKNFGINRMESSNNQSLNVGVFWLVDNTIVGDVVELDEALPYGEALQHGEHSEFWEKLKASNNAEYKFKSHAYDYYPRGRMVCFPNRQTVRLYIDPCMNGDAVNSALTFFSPLGYEVEIDTDEHYRCAGCNPHFME